MTLKYSFNRELNYALCILKGNVALSKSEKKRLLDRLVSNVGFALHDLAPSLSFTNEEKLYLRKVKRDWKQRNIDRLYTSIENYLDTIGYLG